MASRANVRIEPCNVTFGDDAAQVATVTTVADVSSSLNNCYFLLYSASNAAQYYVHFNVGGAGSDPSLSGMTAIAVAIAANATANDVASAVQAAVDAVGAFGASVSSNVVTITNAANGYASGPYDGGSGVATGFTFAVTTNGDAAADAGYTDGAISVSIAPDLHDIVATQTGTNVLGQIMTGKQVEITVNFQETSGAQMRKLLTRSGDSFTPAGAASSEVVGFGTSKDFEQTYGYAAKLVLHPTALGASDKSRDYTFWKAYPILSEIPFDGENRQIIPVTFKIYPDMSKTEEIRFFARGDGTQTLT